MQRDDARQRGDAADEFTHLVIRAGQLDLDRQLCVEVFLDLGGRLEELLFEPGADAHLRDVHEQVRNLGLARQLAQQGAERTLDVRELLLVDLEIHGFRMLGLEGVAQGLFFGDDAIEDRLLIGPDEEVEEQCRENHEAQRHRADADRQRPATRIVRDRVT